jgi:hypothetical protein
MDDGRIADDIEGPILERVDSINAASRLLAARGNELMAARDPAHAKEIQDIAEQLLALQEEADELLTALEMLNGLEGQSQQPLLDSIQAKLAKTHGRHGR